MYFLHEINKATLTNQEVENLILAYCGASPSIIFGFISKEKFYLIQGLNSLNDYKQVADVIKNSLINYTGTKYSRPTAVFEQLKSIQEKDQSNGIAIHKRTELETTADGVNYKHSWLVDRDVPSFAHDFDYLVSHITKAWTHNG